MYQTATSHDDRRNAQLANAAGTSSSGINVPGAIFAVMWAAGLVTGLIALAIGHEALAAVSLVFAVMSPWIGLAWVSRSRPMGGFSGPVAPPKEWRQLEVTAR